MTLDIDETIHRLGHRRRPDRFPHEEFVALRRALPHAKGFWLDAHARGTNRSIKPRVTK